MATHALVTWIACLAGKARVFESGIALQPPAPVTSSRTELINKLVGRIIQFGRYPRGYLNSWLFFIGGDWNSVAYPGFADSKNAICYQNE
jgi:hypothetical protein